MFISSCLLKRMVMKINLFRVCMYDIEREEKTENYEPEQHKNNLAPKKFMWMSRYCHVVKYHPWTRFYSLSDRNLSSGHRQGHLYYIL